MSDADHTNPGTASDDEPVVIILDDDATLSGLFQFWLERDGWPTVCVTNLTEAVEVQQHHRVLALIADYELGDRTTGVDAALRLSVSQPDLPVVIVSGYTEDRLGLDAVDANIKFLRKPFPPDALTDHLGAVLQGFPSSPSVRRYDSGGE